MTDRSDTARRAAAFRQTRAAHLTEVAEDYVELIGDLIHQQGEARLSDIAENMAVSQPTVSKIVARLRREGLVVSRPYRSIFLTEAGAAMAAEARRKHAIVARFLRALGVDEATVDADSEGIEHHVSDRTLAALAQLSATLEQQALKK
ncbi:manganese-binding transcriptional regulator MntR [Sphingomonas oligophenolica]|uniref:Transcriptional regulator MntR n=1 Tax=Sphingomonas oligophenolica TaxID=301154 RepID=A0A502CHK0_9SPHN|nr:manganese-binding transcriptional regulator MntR [Sphingomonas oligophenolica]TPG12192.1 transcriptional regulator MntR [Sphingomonas oligophenolica]